MLLQMKLELVCIRHVAQYLRWTLHFALFYEPVQDLKWHCYPDANWAPEGDYSHQAVAIYLGTNLVAWQSQRQSLVALSSAEAELIASVWGNRLALSLYGQLNEISKPPCITYCDNSAVVRLTQQLSASKTRTRHLSMRASWLHHLAQHENVSMQFVPTAHQKADILTKGLTAYAHELADRDFDSRYVMACEDAWDYQTYSDCVLGSHHVPDFH